MNIATTRRPFRSLSGATLVTALLLSPLHAAAAGKGPAGANTDVGETAAVGSTAGQSDAKTLYEQGVQAYREQRFEDAIELFLSADRLAPRPALAFNVARAYEKLELPARALQHYREYLRRGADVSNREDIERRVRELQAALAESGIQQVTVRSRPTGATVSIDDEVRGVTPWTGELPIGTHQLIARYQDYESVSIELTLDASRAQDLELAIPATADGALPTGPGAAAGHGSVGPRSVTSGSAEGREETSLQPWPWVAVGAGGAALAAAGVFELLRLDAESEAKSARYQTDYYEDRERMSSRQTAARVLLGVSAVLVLTGGVLALIDGAAVDTEHAPVALGCDTTTCVGTWMGNF